MIVRNQITLQSDVADGRMIPIRAVGTIIVRTQIVAEMKECNKNESRFILNAQRSVGNTLQTDINLPM
jgi:hypothetical protein